MINNIVLLLALVAPFNPDDYRWYLYDSSSSKFVILSLDEEQGKYLYENIENIVNEFLNKWGFNLKFETESKIVCVPNKDLLKACFGIENSFVEPNVIWLLTDNLNFKPYIAELCLLELERQNNMQLPFWVHRGIFNVENLDIKELIKNSSEIDSKKVFTLTSEDYKKLSENEKVKFDIDSTIISLLIKKEYGTKKFLGFISSLNLKQVLNFESNEHFDEVLNRYRKDLTNDINSGRVPESYLEK